MGKDASAAIPVLHARLEKSEDDYLAHAALAVLEGDVEKHLPAVIARLSDSGSYGRITAVGALGELGPLAREAIPALEQMLNDPDGDVRLMVEQSLAKIRGEPPFGPLDEVARWLRR